MADITKFRMAMERVYGPFADDFSAAETWNPPERSGGHRGRYLWTDAFGVVNFITLSKETSNPIFLTHAVRLVETVHDVLGRTRDGKARLPGASDENQLGGGLRIGKDDEDGSDGDGQYHHYLTLWMFALNRLSKATNEKKYNDQAIALAKAIHTRFFLDNDTSKPSMVWKISMDMSKPLVYSQGNLDPINGHVIFHQLQANSEDQIALRDEIEDYKRILDLKAQHQVSTDPLDLGMTVWAAHWLSDHESWFEKLESTTTRQCINVFESGLLDRSISKRLAFREYGACLGIACLSNPDGRLLRYRERILKTWEGQDDSLPITEVMRAAAMIPGSFRRGYLSEEHAG